MILGINYSDCSAKYQQINKLNKQSNNISFGKFPQIKKLLKNNSAESLSFETRRMLTSLTVLVMFLAGSFVSKMHKGNTIQENKPITEITENNVAENDGISMIVSSVKPVERRSVIIQEKQKLWNIAKDECDNLYGKGNYTEYELNDKVRYLAKLNNLPRVGDNDAYLVHKGDEIVTQEAGNLYNATINGHECRCFINEQKEAWVTEEFLDENGEKDINLIYMNNVTLIKNTGNLAILAGKPSEDSRYLDLHVTNPTCSHEENKLVLFDE